MVSTRPEYNTIISKIYAFEVPSSTEWAFHKSDIFTPTYYNGIYKFKKEKEKLLNIYSKEMRLAPHSRSLENIMNISKIRGKSVGLKYCEAFKLIYGINSI